MSKDILFYQLFARESSTSTYLLADRDTREAVLIDPVLETVDRDLQLLQEHGLRLLYILETRVHADPITGAGELRKRTGAKIGVAAKAKVACAELALEEGQEIRFGRHTLRVLETPGHTDGRLSFCCEGRVLTGDARPANLQCEKIASARVFQPQIVNGVPEITPQDLRAHLTEAEVVMIDVRRPEEFTNELGHVPGSKLVTLGEDLSRHLATLPREQEIVFICRSGARSGRATLEAAQSGFKKAVNMQGGMLLWNDLNFPTEGRSVMEGTR